MKYEYLKGGEKDFEGAPDWAMVAIRCSGFDNIDFATSLKNGERCYYADNKSEHLINNDEMWHVIAERQPITEPSWDGVWVPPVGCECEAMIHNPATAGCAWRKVKVVHVGEPGSKTEALVFDMETTYPSWADELRPLRSEADKRREDALLAMNIAVNEGESGVIDGVVAIYDAISAGKIPGVKLEG